VRSPADVADGDVIRTQFAAGSVTSRVDAGPVAGREPPS